MKKITFCIVFFVFLAASSTSYAETPAGQAGAFLRMGIGARAIGMGNAFTGLARDGFAGYYNPGSLPFMENPELAFSLAVMSLDRSHSYIGFSTYLQPESRLPADSTTSQKSFRGGFALGWIHAGVSNIDGRDSDGNHIGIFSNSENAFFGSFALQPTELVGIGLTVKVVLNRFPGLKNNDDALSATGLGFDLGIYSTPLPNLSLGAVVRDISTKYTWDTENLWERGSKTVNEFPTLFRIGAAYKALTDGVVSLDAEFNQEQGWRIYLGGEMDFRDNFIARAGYNADRVTLGFGVKFKIWKYAGELDYAYDTISLTPGAEQHISWRVVF
jgi:hypothetical protein